MPVVDMMVSYSHRMPASSHLVRKKDLVTMDLLYSMCRVQGTGS